MNTQVKTYTDHGNGHSVIRTGNSSHYSKVSSSLSLICVRFDCESLCNLIRIRMSSFPHLNRHHHPTDNSYEVLSSIPCKKRKV
jgi:hypothetical protein